MLHLISIMFPTLGGNMFARILPANMLGALTWKFKNHCSYETSNCITFITNLLKSDIGYIGLLNALSRVFS
jgi:hypothetical protein